jgi:hypothetical protein
MIKLSPDKRKRVLLKAKQKQIAKHFRKGKNNSLAFVQEHARRLRQSKPAG